MPIDKKPTSAMDIEAILYQTIELIVQERIVQAPYTQIIEGIITNKTRSDGINYYDVNINDFNYSNIRAINDVNQFNIDDRVFLFIPNNNFSLKYIMGLVDGHLIDNVVMVDDGEIDTSSTTNAAFWNQINIMLQGVLNEMDTIDGGNF